MGVLYVVLILILGFRYTETDISARYRQTRSEGWDAYFHVGKWGVNFVVRGAVAVALFYLGFLTIDALSFVFNFVFGFGALSLSEFIFNFKIADIRIDTIFVAFFAFGLCEHERKNSKIEMADPKKRYELFSSLVRSDGLESLILQSINGQRLILISLKSRKVYVGLVQHTAIFNGDVDNNITIIPFLSGYRDKDELTFHVSHSYLEYYLKHKIEWERSKEKLCLLDFRTIIPIEQIETASLFDPDTYDNFQDLLRAARVSEKKEREDSVLDG